VTRDGAPTPSLRGMGLRLSVALGLDGVTNITVVTNLVPCGGTPRRKITPLLLQRLATSGPRQVEAIAGGVVVAPRCLRGVSIGAPPIGIGRRPGRPGEHGTERLTLGLLLKGDTKEPLRFVQLLVGL
jgi:hypothetical protein